MSSPDLDLENIEAGKSAAKPDQPFSIAVPQFNPDVELRTVC